MPVRFHFQKVVTIRDKQRLKKFIPDIFGLEKKQMESLDFIFCSNPYLLRINRDFLNHDFFTDIVTFDMSEPLSKAISGEIYISVDMVKINSKEFQTTFKDELNRVIFHGILHLCGYKDKSGRDKKVMKEKENYYINRYSLYLKAGNPKK